MNEDQLGKLEESLTELEDGNQSDGFLFLYDVRKFLVENPNATKDDLIDHILEYDWWLC